MTLAEDKAALRRAAFARRKTAHAEGLDVAAQTFLASHLRAWAGRPLAGYLPIRTEIDPTPVMAAWTGPVGVPVVEGSGRPLRFRAWRPGCTMMEGPFGILVPENGEEIVPDVLIVPLAAFDDRGVRLGYGGGFYDRTLAELKARAEVHAVGFAYSAQHEVSLPYEATDVPLDAVVTEHGVLLPLRDALADSRSPPPKEPGE
jgi:5-formyltetrahydrofolate cyclo-ligase